MSKNRPRYLTKSRLHHPAHAAHTTHGTGGTLCFSMEKYQLVFTGIYSSISPTRFAHDWY